jgi:hypothetical protein
MSFILTNVILINAIFLSVFLLNVIVLNVIYQSAIQTSVILLNVAAVRYEQRDDESALLISIFFWKNFKFASPSPGWVATSFAF